MSRTVAALFERHATLTIRITLVNIDAWIPLQWAPMTGRHIGFGVNIPRTFTSIEGFKKAVRKLLLDRYMDVADADEAVASIEFTSLDSYRARVGEQTFRAVEVVAKRGWT